MARPERHDVDYFPFYAKRGKTLNILQSKYGLEGIGFFTNLMRFLSLTPDHYYCMQDETERLNLFAEIGIDENKGLAMIELMVKTGKLDKELWEKYKVIVSQAFLESIKDAYKKRSIKIITIEEIKKKFDGSGVSVPENPENQPDNPAVTGLSVEISSHNPQRKVKKSKVKETKVKKSKVNSIGSSEPIDNKQSPKQKESKPKKLPLREREPVNDMERVEKVYLQNWDSLYLQGKVKTPDPFINWGQTRNQIKKLFEKHITPEQIIQVINNGLKDEWVMKKGYSLSVLISSTVMNSFINSANGATPATKHQREKINLE